MFFCGIDWSDKKFDIVIVNQQGVVVRNFVIKKKADGFERLLDELRAVVPDVNEILISIETPNSPLVDYLMDKGYTIYAINPKAVDRYRDRYRSSGAKDDVFDATVIANILRTDRSCHQPIASNSDLTRELKILSQDREKLIQTKTMLTNQLRSCLKAYYPEVCHLFSDLASPSALTFLKLFPTWEELNNKHEDEIIQLLKEHKVNHPSLLKKIVKHSQTLPIPIDLVLKRAKTRQMVAITDQLISLSKQIKEYNREIKTLLYKHPDKDIFLSLPGAGSNLSSRILSHFGDDRDRFEDVSKIKPLAGVVPVTKQSGNYKKVSYRYSCRKTFRNTMQLFAFCSLSRNRWAYNYYLRHRKMGKTHNHALRCLADKWMKIIFAMWKKRQSYNEKIFLFDSMKHVEKSNRQPILQIA